MTLAISDRVAKELGSDYDVLHAPCYESLDDILFHTKPRGKDVLSVAAYGYPLVFLVAGAERVFSFDVLRRQIDWNYFLRGTILALNYDAASAFFHKNLDTKDSRLAMAQRVAEHIPTIPLERVHQMLLTAYVSESFNDRDYLHLQDEGTYNRVQEKIRAGCWEICHSELLGLSEHHAFDKTRRFDVIYISSIRNYVFRDCYKYGRGEKAFFAEYDAPLADFLTTALFENGMLYEALIHDPEMSRFPFQQQLYRAFTIRHYPSRQKNMQSSVVIARRRKSFGSILTSLRALF